MIDVFCSYLGTSLEDNIVSIFMQFVPGGSIANIIARFGALVEEVFAHYTRQILEGVRYLHANNVIHRSVRCLQNQYLSSSSNQGQIWRGQSRRGRRGSSDQGRIWRGQ